MSKPVARIRFIRFAWLVAGILLGFSAQAWAYSGDTIQDDIAREFNGATSYTIPLSAPTQSVPTTTTANNCETTLQQEMGTGEIPTNEDCYCPVGATQPVCSALPASDCPNLLQIEENRLGTDAQYYDCTCQTGATSPQCTSYYKLCEAALPSYQNSTNECTCSQTATSAVPECTSDYSICESHAGSYENSTTTCTCSQVSTSPDCCTSTTNPNCTTTTQYKTVQTLTGYSCAENDGSSNYYLTGIFCPNTGNSLGNGTSGVNTVPLDFCASDQPPYCYYNDLLGGVVATSQYTSTQESYPVTTCHPITTQSCTQEPG
ncbi:hypothetical protein [Acidithiobacillus sp.]|uniref:hypothetical protein n=1 Tax=Acidithiobacillus sp. TaxID=1872118 RepID=UPI002632A25F|nr:hypothetical protein [Acidithiobacillus sp.]MDD2749916.1 hypothetical protein [Acidithiobacillus sp.]MDD5280734.1 hypothetical protein [Acidithiobacillus sp.]